MNSREVGRSNPPAITLNVPFSFTFTRLPVFGNAGEPSATPSQTPCDSATPANLHIDEEPGTRGDLGCGWRLRPKGHDFAVLGQVGNGTSLGHVDRVPRHRQSSRDGVSERDELADLAVERDA